MSHKHSDHHNHHLVNEFNKKFKIGIILNFSFVIVELVFGLFNNSLALIADAGHNFSDVISLVFAWTANYLIMKEPTSNFTYGFKKSSIMAALLNSLILVAALGIILWEAVSRFQNPYEVKGNIIIMVAGIGVIINGITTYLFLGGKEKDLNVKGAYLHMLNDTLISFGVVISGILILLTNLYWLDPLISIIIVMIIFWGTWGLLRDSAILSLDGVPLNVKLKEVENFLLNHEEVESIHDLHIWALSTFENALTVHLVVNEMQKTDQLLQDINSKLNEYFNVSHTTIQFENNNCNISC
jgi:cobalt-zinc-cadmium efflux system protein